MIKFFLIFALSETIVIGALILLWWKASSKIKKQKDTIEDLAKQLTDAWTDNNTLREMIDILKRNRKEADEKINELHNGDSVDNAINLLQQHKD